MQIRVYAFWIALVGWTFASYGAPFSLSLDSQEVSVGEAVTLTLSITEGELTQDIQLPRIPDVAQGGSGRSSSVTIVNGQISRQIAYTFPLVPQKMPEKGKRVTIPSFVVEIDHKRYSTEPLSFVVTEPGASIPGAGVGAEDHDAGAGAGESAEGKAPAVFIQREFSNPTPYENEPMVSTVKIYHRVDLAKAEVAGDSKPPDMRVLTLGEDRGQEQMGGQVYQVIRLREVWVPTKSGALHVPSFRLQVGMMVPSQRRSQGLFGFFDQGRMVSKVVASREEDLSVRPLPKDPRDQLGLVGEFTGTVRLSTDHLKVGETATLTLKIEGRGALDRLGKLSLPFPSGIRAYDDKPEIKEEASATKGLLSRSTFKFALVPSQAGTFPLGEYRLVFFNPAKGAFSEIVVPLGTLTVDGSVDANGVAMTALPPAPPPAQKKGGEKQTVSAISTDLVDIYRGEWPSEGKNRTPIVGLVAFFLSCLLYGGARIRAFSRRRGKRGISKAQARKQFDAEVQRAASLDPLLSARKVYEALRVYLGALSGRYGAALTGQELEALVKERGLKPEVAALLHEIAARLEADSFSPHALQAEEARQKVAQMVALAKEMV